MAPIPSLLRPLLGFAVLWGIQLPATEHCGLPNPYSMSSVRGTVSFRRTRVVDTAIGFDTAEEHPENLTADRAVYISNDGMRKVDELLNVGHKRRRLRPGELSDPLANWVPVDDDGVDLKEDVELLGEMEKVSGTGKRKRYESSDDPMAQWRAEKQFFLDETIRRHGLGDAMHSPHCAICKEGVGMDSSRFFRCVDCGEFLQCEQCCVARHQLTPLHSLEEWAGGFWTSATLRDIGLVYQLGHEGRPCTSPAPAVRCMVVVDTNGIHRVSYRYCGCDHGRAVRNLSQLMRNAWYPASLTDPATCATYRVLEMFRLMTVIGNVNARDFVTALERRTEPLGPSGLKEAQTPDRYREFARMARQYAFLQRLCRAGRGHDAAGVNATKLGELTVMCWACPHDGRNLPDDWRDVDPKYRFLFMLMVALDANFKLKNRLRANERYDPPLGPGWGAFVEPTQYRDHLKNYVGETDISTCIAFAALLQKDTRLTTGLRTSGVGGCVCARHECVRPNGIGDLQKGERYANMDYIVMAALAGLALMMVTISYDIACQWRKNLPARMEKLPPAIRLDLTKTELQTGLPVWHASSHELEATGKGWSSTWADLNPAAFHTKEMGYGNRADALEDKIDSHNFQKNLGQAYAIRRKLVVAIAERARQVGAFKEVNKSVSRELRDQWQEDIAAFIADHDKPNPYILARADGPTEAQIRVALKKDEEDEARKSGSPLHGVSATAFLVAGLQLEEAQRRIKSEIAGHALVTADRESKIQERRLAFLSKYRKFQRLQEIYTPGAARASEAAMAALDPDAPPIPAEKIQLFMPSELSAEERERGCQRGIAAMEARLREAQCSDALIALRSHLHSKRHLITFRNKNVTGQVKATKSRTLIGSVRDKATAAANKYRQGRAALLRLRGPDHAPHFRELKDADLTLDGEEAASDTAARKKLSMLSAGKGARTPRHIAGSSKRVLSWIWTAAGALDDDEEELHASIRVEWCRAKARKNRWEEEVELLREEARRVVRYLEWYVRWWNDRSRVREMESEEMRGGLAAYAKKSAATFAKLSSPCSCITMCTGLARGTHYNVPFGLPPLVHVVMCTPRHAQRREFWL
ncbi:hypothetical protein B0H11DRAFT_2266968 [Mycena galericulata]|nr:hypothetical protein B0H11DRAFT_2266968 [Mycena galericulata]